MHYSTSTFINDMFTIKSTPYLTPADLFAEGVCKAFAWPTSPTNAISATLADPLSAIPESKYPSIQFPGTVQVAFIHIEQPSVFGLRAADGAT